MKGACKPMAVRCPWCNTKQRKIVGLEGTTYCKCACCRHRFAVQLRDGRPVSRRDKDEADTVCLSWEGFLYAIGK